MYPECRAPRHHGRGSPFSTLKLAVEIFDGTGHFGMWQGEVLDSLFQQGLDIAIEGEKPKEVEEKDCPKLQKKGKAPQDENVAE